VCVTTYRHRAIRTELHWVRSGSLLIYYSAATCPKMHGVRSSLKRRNTNRTPRAI